MYLGNFTLHHPTTLSEACRLSRELGRRSALLAGGTELLVDLRSGRKSVDHVISLGKIQDLQRIRREADLLRIGAMVPLGRIAEAPEVHEFFPALSEAVLLMAGRQIRNLGTMGGNFSCGVPCSDTPVISCAGGAKILIAGIDGERTVPARTFVIAPRLTVLEPGEILCEIRFRRQPAGAGASYQRFSLRGGSALAVASVAAWVRLEAGILTEARIVMGAVGPIPLFAERAAALLPGQRPSDDLFAAAGRTAATEAQPISDLRGSAQYRRDVVEVLTRRALTAAVQRAEGSPR